MHGMVVEDPASAAGKCGKGLRQAEAQGAIIRGGQFAGHRHQRLAESVAGRKAPDARHRVTRKHRCAIVKPQPSRSRIVQSVPSILDSVPFDHLRLSGKRLVQAIERIEYQVAVVVRCAVPAPDRIE